MKNFFDELKRRNVYKVAVAYAVGSWLVVQASSLLLATFEAPPWAMKAFVVFVALGFPIALILSWAFEITPEGIVRESEVEPGKSITHYTGRKIVAITVACASAGAALFALQLVKRKGSGDKSGAANPTVEKSEIKPNSVAVLAFDNLSDDKGGEYFSDGISEELLTVLQKIPGLRVAARTSAFSFKGENATAQEIGEKLSVANLVEGSVRKAGDNVRIAARLTRADNGEQLWSENYTRDAKDVFAVQTELAQTIVEQLRGQLGDGDKSSATKEKVQAEVQAAEK